MSSVKHGLEGFSASLRVGFGTDVHPLAAGEGIWLGGVPVPCSHGSVADSDGDVLLHALVDALLGACGWGDIGEWFPASSVEPGTASSTFVAAVLERMRDHGLIVVNVDATVDLEVVRLAPWKPVIRERVAVLLDTPPERVNIKAKTAEGMGAVGEGRAVAAQAAVLVGGF